MLYKFPLNLFLTFIFTSIPTHIIQHRIIEINQDKSTIFGIRVIQEILSGNVRVENAEGAIFAGEEVITLCWCCMEGLSSK
jgi:hypothetical protein